MKAFVLALAALWAGAVFAQAPATNTGNTQQSHMQNLALLLDLTPAQTTQVQTILQDEHQQMKQAFESAKSSGTQPNWQQLRTLHQQIEQDTITKLTPVLNATQLQKFQALQKMHRGFHHRRPPGTSSGSAPADASTTTH
jgi:hypothetical protein